MVSIVVGPLEVAGEPKAKPPAERPPTVALGKEAGVQLNQIIVESEETLEQPGFAAGAAHDHGGAENDAAEMIVAHRDVMGAGNVGVIAVLHVHDEVVLGQGAPRADDTQAVAAALVPRVQGGVHRGLAVIRGAVQIAIADDEIGIVAHLAVSPERAAQVEHDGAVIVANLRLNDVAILEDDIGVAGGGPEVDNADCKRLRVGDVRAKVFHFDPPHLKVVAGKKEPPAETPRNVGATLLEVAVHRQVGDLEVLVNGDIAVIAADDIHPPPIIPPQVHHFEGGDVLARAQDAPAAARAPGQRVAIRLVVAVRFVNAGAQMDGQHRGRGLRHRRGCPGPISAVVGHERVHQRIELNFIPAGRHQKRIAPAARRLAARVIRRLLLHDPHLLDLRHVARGFREHDAVSHRLAPPSSPVAEPDIHGSQNSVHPHRVKAVVSQRP